MDIQPQSIPERVAASITGVVDSLGNPVSNGGITQDTELTLSGSGTASSVIFIYDNGVLLTTASVTINGTWSFSPETLVLGQHVFTVRDGSGGVDSPEWVVTVDSAELDLGPPAVTQAPTDALNPVDAISGATVVVTYAMQPTDTIGISWNGQDNLVHTQPGSALGSVTFTVPPTAVAAVIGKTIPVLYAAVRNGVEKPSEVLSLTVQTLADSVLEAPRILQAPDNMNLDVAALTADADLRVKPWPFIAAGQLISLRFEGTKADGSAHNWLHRTWQNLPISSTGEPGTTVGVNNLKTLKDGSTLKLIFEVSFDGGLTSVLFPTRTLTIIKITSGFEDFEKAPPGVIHPGSSMILASGVKLDVLSEGLAPPVAIVRAGSQQGEHGFQYFSIGVNDKYFNYTFLTLPATTFSHVEFTLWAVNNVPGLGCGVVFFVEGGAEQLVYTAPVGSRLLVRYTAPAGKHVLQLRVANKVAGQGSIAFDSLRWSA